MQEPGWGNTIHLHREVGIMLVGVLLGDIYCWWLHRLQHCLFTIAGKGLMAEGLCEPHIGACQIVLLIY